MKGDDFGTITQKKRFAENYFTCKIVETIEN